MNKKLLQAALVVLLACAGVWILLDESGQGRGGAPSVARAPEPGAADAGRPSEVALAPASAPTEAPGTAPERTDASARARELAAEHESFALEGARWVDVTVVLPNGVPPDDEANLLGFARKNGGDVERFTVGGISEQLGLDDAFVAALGEEHHWSRRPLARSVRMPFPAEGSEAVLFVQSRYLHLDPVELDLRTDQALTIEPELGGWVTGRCVVPAGHAVKAEDIGVEFDGRERDSGLMGFARPDQRDVRVKDDLSFELRALSAARKYAVVAKAKGLVGHFELSFEIRPGEHREVVLELRPGATLAGFVRGDGGPVEGARVRVDARVRMPWVDDVSALSGEDGAFVLEGVPTGKLTLEATMDGWREGKSEHLEVAEGQRVEGIEIVLDSGLRIRGRVQWPDGTPVAGARVSAWRVRQRWLQSVVEATSEAEGAFVLGGLEDGVVELFASHAPPEATSGSAVEKVKQASDEQRSFGPRRAFRQHDGWMASLQGVTPGSAGLVLTLQPPHEVTGTVVDDTGAPAGNFSISAQRAGRENAPEAVQENFEAARGSFTLGVGLEGEWSFEASLDDRRSDPVTLPVPQGGAELRLVLPRKSAIAGVVLDPGGNPVPDANVYLTETAQEAPFARFSGESATSGPDGRFQIASGKRGGFAHAAHDDWATSEIVALQLVPGEELVDVVLHLRAGARITGVVYDDAGKPRAGQNVNCASGAMAAMAGGFGAERSAVTDGSGRFTFERVTPGKVTVTAMPSEEELMARFQNAEGEEQAFLAMLGDMNSTSVEVADGGEAHVVLGAKPKQPVRVHGRVTEAGSALSEKQVFAFAEGGSLLAGMKFTRTDGAGRYELLLDRPGDYVFGVALQDGMQGTGTQFYVAVPEVPELEQDLALPLARVAGVVLGADGPVAGVPMRLVFAEGAMGMEDLSEGNRTSSGSDGAFAFEHIQPGTYALQVGGDFNARSDERYGQRVIDGLVVEKDRALDGLVVHLEKPGKLAGLVRDPAGNPQGGVTVFVRDAAGRAVSISRCMSDAAGRFTYENLSPGRVTASARGALLVSAESGEFEIRSGETSTLDLTVSEGTFLRVSLLSGDDDGQPVRARLRVNDDAGRRVDDLMSFEDMMGLMSEGFSSRERRVGPLAPGKYTLTATTLDGKDAKKSLMVEAGQSERVVKLRLK